MLKNITTELLQKVFVAIQELQAHYKKHEFDWDPAKAKLCPLCQISMSEPKRYEQKDCFCPWIWFENRVCLGTGGYRDQPISDRLVRLNRWENVIVEELASRRITA